VRESKRQDGLAFAFDARFDVSFPTGVGSLSTALLRGFAATGEAVRLKLLVSRHASVPDDLVCSRRFDLCEAPWSPYGVGNQLLLPRLLRRLGVKVLHTVDCFAPVLARDVKLVVTVHDLIPIACRRMLARSWKSRLLPVWKTWLRLQCARADRVVAVSRSTADDIVRRLHVPRSKIRVIHDPVRQGWETRDPGEVRRELGVEGRVILYVGRQDPYKNIAGLVRAVPAILREAGEDVTLIVAGKLDPRYPEPVLEAPRLGLEDRVRFVGYVDDPTLGSLYRLSEVFVFPSLYEGFGLPPLEAMAFGTPVVSSDRASLPEVLGDAALYVDPEDPARIAESVLRVLSDRALADRLRAAGPARAALFSPRQAAEAHLGLYRELLG
jgi:glycosyltransferase involved in cell wall biosynthesis